VKVTYLREHLMRSHSSLGLCLCACSLAAQPIIQLEHAPQAGDVLPYEQYSALLELLPGGPDQTWDLSGMYSNEFSYTLRFCQPDTTPGFTTYPNADLAGLFDSFLDDWRYHRRSDFGLEYLGLYYVGQIYGTAPYAQRLIPYPASYGTAWLDTVQWCADSNVCRLRNYSCEADGYGTLILPGGTVENVLRTRCSVGTYSDINGVILADTLMEDRYWSPDFPYYLAAVYNSISWHNDELTFMAEADILTDLTVGLKDNVLVRPDPMASYASGTGQLTIVTGLHGSLRSEVIDAMGRTVSSSAQVLAPGLGKLVRALPQLATGRYIHRIHDGEGRVEAVPFMVE